MLCAEYEFPGKNHVFSCIHVFRLTAHALYVVYDITLGLHVPNLPHLKKTATELSYTLNCVAGT